MAKIYIREIKIHWSGMIILKVPMLSMKKCITLGPNSRGLIWDINIHKHLANDYIGLVVRKPVFGVSDKASFKPVSSATETS